MASKNAPSRKKSKGYYTKVNKKGGTGAKAGGGMSAKGVAKYKRDNPGSKLGVQIPLFDHFGKAWQALRSKEPFRALRSPQDLVW